MADTTFVDGVISSANRIVAAWLNTVNNLVYRGTNPLYVTTTGSANAQVATLPVTSLKTTLSGGDTFIVKAGFTNSGSMTLQIVGSSAIAAKTVKTPEGATLAAGQWTVNGVYAVSYEASADVFILHGSALPALLGVVLGGSGRASATAYAVICGGTTSTGALQSVASVGTSGQLLTSNGAGALPTFQTAANQPGRLLSDTIYGVGSQTVTMTIANPCVVTFVKASTTAIVGVPIVFTTSGTLPTGIVSGTTYYMVSVDQAAGTCKVSATRGGTAINTSGSQSGTHTANNPTYNKATNSPTYIEIESLGAGGGGGGVAATAGATGAGGGGGSWIYWFGLASVVAAGNLSPTTGRGGSAGASGGGNGGNGEGSGVANFINAGPFESGGGFGGTFGAASAPKVGGLGGSIGTDSSNNYANNWPGTFIWSRGENGGFTISTAAAATSYSGKGGNSRYGLGAPTNGVGVTAAGVNGYADAAIAYIANPGAGGAGAAGASANAGGEGAAGFIRIREYA